MSLSHTPLPDGLKAKLSQQLLSQIDPNSEPDSDALRQAVYNLVKGVLEAEMPALSRSERERLVEKILADVIGFGVLEPLIRDEMVTEIHIIGTERVDIVQKGALHTSSITFEDESHVTRVMDRLTARTGTFLNDEHPQVDVRLPDVGLLKITLRTENGQVMVDILKSRE